MGWGVGGEQKMKRQFLVRFAHKLDWKDVYCQNIGGHILHKVAWTLNLGDKTLSVQRRNTCIRSRDAFLGCHRVSQF